MQNISNNHSYFIISRKQEFPRRAPAFQVPALAAYGGQIPPPVPIPASEDCRQTGTQGFHVQKVQKYPAKKRGRPKRGLAEWLITGAIIMTILAISASLLFYFHPFTPEDAAAAVRSFAASVSDNVSESFHNLKGQIDGWLTARAGEKTADPFSMEGNSALSPDRGNSVGQENMVSYLNRTTDLGQASDFSEEPIYLSKEDAIYTFMLDTSLGPMLYYSQGDIRWKDYLYGGQDPISRYGCGPVCVAMIINSFSSTGMDPIEMADWSAANGGYARHSGSYHSLIPNSLTAFGLQVESVADRSVEHVSELLNTGHILVALMGRGSLTDNGHFIIIAQLCANGNVYIADPANYENCTKEWELQLLMDELKDANDSGGPLWAVSLPGS